MWKAQQPTPGEELFAPRSVRNLHLACISQRAIDLLRRVDVLHRLGRILKLGRAIAVIAFGTRLLV